MRCFDKLADEPIGESMKIVEIELSKRTHNKRKLENKYIGYKHLPTLPVSHITYQIMCRSCSADTTKAQYDTISISISIDPSDCCLLISMGNTQQVASAVNGAYIKLYLCPLSLSLYSLKGRYTKARFTIMTM